MGWGAHRQAIAGNRMYKRRGKGTIAVLLDINHGVELVTLDGKRKAGPWGRRPSEALLLRPLHDLRYEEEVGGRVIRKDLALEQGRAQWVSGSYHHKVVGL